jgi:YD repeat-containing protein
LSHHNLQYCLTKPADLQDLNYGYIRQLNQYNSVQYNGGTARQILYDANGNMTQLGQKLFTYDGRNRMITAVDSSVSPAMQAQYQYDSMGRRISKTVGSSTIRYCYDGAQVIAEYDGSGTLLRRFV